MAGPETIHKIVEKIEVQGVDKAGKQMDKVGESSKLVATGFFRANLAANLASKAISAITMKLAELQRRAWLVNEEFERMQSRTQGLILGLVDWGEATEAEKITQSRKLTNRLMEEYKDLAVKTATPIRLIEAAHARVNSVLSGMGMNQKEILDITDQAAAAAKVYGDNAEVAGGIVSKAIQEGTVEGETAFAKALKAQANITSKMKPEERLKKVTAVLESMGAPLAVVTRDTESALTRWGILSNDILQRVTYPIYQKIGFVVGEIVDWMTEHESQIDRVISDVSEWGETLWDVGTATYEIWKVVSAWTEELTSSKDMINTIWSSLKLINQTVSIIFRAFETLSELVKVLSGDDSGIGKLYALSASLEVKWLEIQKSILSVVTSLAKLAVPGFIREKVPGLSTFFETLDGIGTVLDRDIRKAGERLRGLEKPLIAAGEIPGGLTQTTREMIADENKALEEALKKTRGRKLSITQQIGKIEIRQDFRDQDPDRILVEFVSDLERLGETALQSTAGGEGMALEGGSSY